MGDKNPLKVGVFGGGAIGCYVGGRLASVEGEQTHVSLLVRERLLGDLSKALTVCDQDGKKLSARTANLTLTVDPSGLADCDIILVTVKSLDTAEAGRSLASMSLKKGTVVVSLQNGVKNTAILSEALGADVHVQKGMVSFNVERHESDGTFAKCTFGPIVVAHPAKDTAPEGYALVTRLMGALNAAGVWAYAVPAHDMEGIQWCKLLFNLNNSINALCGLPLRTELLDPQYRLILRDTMAEALAVLTAAKKPVQRFGTMIPWLALRILPLPTFLYQLAARSALNISPEARSSMAGDIKHGRKTEIDFINGEIVALGVEHNVPTPVNSAICEMIREVEGKPPGQVKPMSAEDIRARITGAHSSL